MSILLPLRLVSLLFLLIAVVVGGIRPMQADAAPAHPLPLAGTRHNAPYFPQATADDQRWKAFAPLGADGEILALVSNGTDIYIGGTFTHVDGVTATRLAHWDGARWEGVGGGVQSVGSNGASQGAIWSLALDDGGNLYVGGLFTRAGTVAANNIARWDGTRWTALGAGIDNEVYTLAVAGSQVYAGGEFASAGGVSVNNIARWDGRAWHAMGNGSVTLVSSIAVTPSANVYALGQFRTADDQSASVLGQWDGSTWTLVAADFYWADRWTLPRLVVAGDDVYLGGYHRARGPTVGRWNGTNWQYLGTLPNAVHHMAMADDGTLYAAGEFLKETPHGNTRRYIARWNNNEWEQAGQNLNEIEPKDYLVASDGAGGILTVDTIMATLDNSQVENSMFVFHLRDDEWVPVISADTLGLSGDAISLAADNQGSIYVSGTFIYAGSHKANGIARWDGTRWWPLGAGVQAALPEESSLPWSVTVAVDRQNNVYVGGMFAEVGGVAANNIARWDGRRWWPLGAGLTGNIVDLDVDGAGNLYAVGRFSIPPDASERNVARWNGKQWTAVGHESAAPDVAVTDMVIDDFGKLYVSYYDWETNSGRIMAWDGAVWEQLSEDTLGGIWTIAPDGRGGLYVGGSFQTIDGVTARKVAHWDGQRWSGVGSGMTPDGYSGVSRLAVDANGDVFAAGTFSEAGGVAVKNVARWDGRRWSPLGSGTDVGINDMLIADNRLILSGYFTTAGAKPTYGLAQWDLIRPVPDVNVDGLYFEPTPLRTTTTALTTTLTNRGNAPLPIKRIVATGTDAAAFGVTSDCPATLAVGARCRIAVTFRPSRTGTHDAALTLLDTSGADRLSVPLQGEGVRWRTYLPLVLTARSN